MIVILLAGGRGSRLSVLTQEVTKPAVSFGGKYRIIDLPPNNCTNPGVDTVGVLTQYQPLRLNPRIGIDILWDLDRNTGGVTVLPPYGCSRGSDWYTGTVNATYQNLEYMETYNPEYALILSDNHIYEIDHEVMLDYHKVNNTGTAITTMSVPIEKASRSGILITDESNYIMEFEEKPSAPRGNLTSMGIYIFSWLVLREALIKMKDESGYDFGKHITPYHHAKGDKESACEYNGHWKDADTLGSYWEANMELIGIIPKFDLYEEHWKIYTKSDVAPPRYISCDANTKRSITGEGTEIYGEVVDSVIGVGVTTGREAMVCDSIVMQGSAVGTGNVVDKAVTVKNAEIGSDVQLRVSEYAPNTYGPKVYQFDSVTIGENSVMSSGMRVGKNTAIMGDTTVSDYPDGLLVGGGYITKAGGIK